MFKPLALFIGLRYTRAQKRNHFISFIALSSMLGIGLGVMVLITVLSVMNGFDYEIRKRFFGMAPEITINGRDGKINNWQKLIQDLKKNPEIKAAAPFVGTQGLLTREGQVLPVVISGILPKEELKISQLNHKIISGNLRNLNHFGIFLGQNLADNLGLMIGDKVTVMIPQTSVNITGMIPRFKQFTVQGIFSIGSGFGFDNKLVFINLEDAQKLLQLGTTITGIKLKIDNIYTAPQLSQQLSTQLGESFEVGNWTEQFGPFFQAVKMEKTMMFLILLLIIAVAVFNLVSSLVMVVNDKQAEIAILRTIGARPSTILTIFIIQGMLIGLAGTLLGIVSGILLAYNATDIVNWLQQIFQIKLLSSNIYFVDYLPSKILVNDIWQVGLIALFMSFIATIYPARKASKTVIAQALHYE